MPVRGLSASVTSATSHCPASIAMVAKAIIEMFEAPPWSQTPPTRGAEAHGLGELLAVHHLDLRGRHLARTARRRRPARARRRRRALRHASMLRDTVDRPGSLPNAVWPMPAMTALPRIRTLPPSGAPGIGSRRARASRGRSPRCRLRAPCSARAAAARVGVAHRAGREDDLAEQRMVDPPQRAAGVQVRVVHDLAEVAHRRARHAMAHEQVEQVLLAEAAASSRTRSRRRGPCGRRGPSGWRSADPARGPAAPWPSASAAQWASVTQMSASQPSVGRVDVVGRLGEPAVPVAGPRRPAA